VLGLFFMSLRADLYQRCFPGRHRRFDKHPALDDVGSHIVRDRVRHVKLKHPPGFFLYLAHRWLQYANAIIAEIFGAWII
jgi:hypothetical protein